MEREPLTLFFFSVLIFFVVAAAASVCSEHLKGEEKSGLKFKISDHNSGNTAGFGSSSFEVLLNQVRRFIDALYWTLALRNGKITLFENNCYNIWSIWSPQYIFLITFHRIWWSIHRIQWFFTEFNRIRRIFIKNYA